MLFRLLFTIAARNIDRRDIDNFSRSVNKLDSLFGIVREMIRNIAAVVSVQPAEAAVLAWLEQFSKDSILTLLPTTVLPSVS
jgi:hypothetical protein